MTSPPRLVRQAWYILGGALLGGLLCGANEWRESTIAASLDRALETVAENPERAERLASGALETWTRHADFACVVRAAAFTHLGRAEEAAGCWLTVTAPRRVSPPTLLTLVRAASERGDRLLAWLVLIAADRPETPRTDWLTAALLTGPSPRDLGTPDLAALAAELERTTSPGDGLAWLALAEHRMRSSRYAPAALAFAAALEATDPALVGAARHRAEERGLPLLAEIGELDRAAPLLQSALDAGRSSSPLWYGRALCDRANGRLESALSGIERACKIAAPNPRYEALRGAILVGLKRYDDAEKVLSAAIQRFPDAPEPRHRLAEVLRIRGNRSELPTRHQNSHLP